MNGGVCVGPLSAPSPRWKHFPNTEFKESLGEACQQEADILPGALSTSPNRLSSWGSGLSFRTVSEEPRRSAWAPTPDPDVLEGGWFLGKRNEGDPHGSRGGSDDLGFVFRALIKAGTQANTEGPQPLQ